jgi:translation initiation factor IF-2
VDSLREAGVHREDFRKMTRCRAQAAGLMREERAGERMLAQEQKMRRATESVAGGMPAQPGVAFALPQQAAPRSAPPPIQAAVAAPQSSAAVPPEAAPPAAAPIRPAATRAAPPPVQEAAEPPPSPEATAKAEAFAQENPVAAAQIRHDRGVTPQNTAYFRHVKLPTAPAVTDALVRGSSDLLTFLDEVGGDELDKAA